MKRENLALLLPSNISVLNGWPISAKIAPFPYNTYNIFELNKVNS